MFTNKPACTIWEKTVQNRAPTYIRHETGAVYWENTDALEITASGNGTSRENADNAFIIIPAKSISGYVPKKDDRILPGSIPDVQPPPSALTVISVKDFRYGSSTVQHLEVNAK